MRKILSSQITWVIAAIIIGVCAWLFPINSQRTSLNIAVTQNAQLTPTIDLTKNNSLAFVYNQNLVNNLISTKIRLENDGNKSVEETDFIEGLNITFPADTHIIDYKVTRVQPFTDPGFFQQTFVTLTNKNELKFTPTLINPGEIFDIDIVTTRQGVNLNNLAYGNEDIKFRYRIREVTQINSSSKIDTNFDKRAESRKSLKDVYDNIRPFGIGFLIILIISFLAKLLPKKNLPQGEQKKNTVADVIIGVIFILFILALMGILFYSLATLIYNAWFLEV